MKWTDESITFLRDAAAMNRYYETIAEKIAPQFPENARVCDAGCGIGELSLALKPYCRHVTAGPPAEFPCYLPHEKALCLFTVETADICLRKNER